MATIRFFAPARNPQLSIRDLSVQFVDGVLDLNESDPRTGPLKYRGTPYGVTYMGPTTAVGSPIEQAFGQAIEDLQETVAHKVSAVGSVRLWAPSTAFPTANVQSGDLFPYIGTASSRGIYAYSGGTWIYLGSTGAVIPPPDTDPGDGNPPTLTTAIVGAALVGGSTVAP